MEPLINATRVGEILMACFAGTDSSTPIVVEGIVHTYGLNALQLEEHRSEVGAMLKNLPLQFRPESVGGGGGWTFLQACQDANDEQWTGLHTRMEQLFVLGIALGIVEWMTPRETWPVFPGGVPYVSVKI